VVYLRALQEGECLFPYVLRDTPTAKAMMNHLALAYPEVRSSPPRVSVTVVTVTINYCDSLAFWPVFPTICHAFRS